MKLGFFLDNRKLEQLLIFRTAILRSIELTVDLYDNPQSKLHGKNTFLLNYNTENCTNAQNIGRYSFSFDILADSHLLIMKIPLWYLITYPKITWKQAIAEMKSTDTIKTEIKNILNETKTMIINF